ncbi:MAG: GspE/PulE family protein [Candidatus Staskawiczbacteria bacterium]|nr:GspE/PulE family protein [Candidatus Staskawiczbacteria bacterium]
MKVELQKLKKFILEAGLIEAKKFDEAMEESEKSKKGISEVLISKGLITEKELIKIEAYILGIPFINLEEEIIPLDVLKIIPETIARAHNIIAFNKKENNLEVAMLDPEDLRTIEFIKKAAPSLKILARLTTSEGIKNALAQYQETLETEFGDIMKSGAGGIKHIKIDESISGKKEELQKVAEEVSIIRVVDTLMKHAILQRTSDVHIEPLEKEVIIRYRIDGILHDVMSLPINTASGIVARIKVLSNLKLDEHRLPQDGRFKIETEDFKYSVRVSVLPVLNGEKIVMRLLAEDNKDYTLEDLGFAGLGLEKVRHSLLKTTGMVLITGPTGSGKTTTLYAMMGIINTTSVNISTVEDPIEYRMPRINQTQINDKIDLTFASGLRALVRQDPNIIMVGEIRDRETADLAINAALTGHLVLSTLHTTEAGGAIPRLIDMGTEPFLLSSTLNIIIGQRLVRKFYGDKEKYKLNAADLENLQKYCDMERIVNLLKEEKILKQKDTIKDLELYRPKPSKNSSSGYKGRIGIFEILSVNDAIKNLINKKASTVEITKQAIQDGMRTMAEDGFIKAAQGITSLEEVLRVIMD